jgi:sirohydrochlorin ferrochelatase
LANRGVGRVAGGGGGGLDGVQAVEDCRRRLGGGDTLWRGGRHLDRVESGKDLRRRLSAGHSLCQGLVAVLEQSQLVAGLLLSREQGVEAGGLVRGLALEELA